MRRSRSSNEAVAQKESASCKVISTRMIDSSSSSQTCVSPDDDFELPAFYFQSLAEQSKQFITSSVHQRPSREISVTKLSPNVPEKTRSSFSIMTLEEYKEFERERRQKMGDESLSDESARRAWNDTAIRQTQCRNGLSERSANKAELSRAA